MYVIISDLFPFIFDWGNVAYEMWHWVPLIPVVMKFGPTHRGHCMSSFMILSHSGKKLVEGQLWADVTQVTIWGHIRLLTSMSPVI